MSSLTRELAVVIRITEVSDLSTGNIQVVGNTIASNIMNRDELIGLLTRAVWSVGHGSDKQIVVSTLQELVQQMPPAEPLAEA